VWDRRSRVERAVRCRTGVENISNKFVWWDGSVFVYLILLYDKLLDLSREGRARIMEEIMEEEISRDHDEKRKQIILQLEVS
jgi:hypothetical protein